MIRVFPKLSRIWSGVWQRWHMRIICGVLGLSLLLAWSAWVSQKDMPHVDVASVEGALLAADFAERENNIAASVYYYDIANRMNPNSPRILAKLFHLHLVLGQMDEVLDLARRLVVFYPHDKFVRIVLIVDALKQDDFESTLAHIKDLPQEDDAQLIGHIVTLWTQHALGNSKAYKESVAQITESIEQTPLFASVGLHNLAMFHDFVGETEKAYEVYARLMKMRGVRTIDHILDYLFFLHRNHKEEERDRFFQDIGGNYEEHAIYRHVKMILNEPAMPLDLSVTEATAFGLQAMAGLHLLAASNDEDIAYARIAYWLMPDNRRTTMTIAQLLADADKYEEAIHLYQRIDEDVIFGETARVSIGLLHEVRGNTATAIQLLEAEKMREPSYFTVKILADMLRRHEKYSLAEAHYTFLINQFDSVSNRNWGLFYGRGVARERQSKWKEAEIDLLIAKEFSGNRPHVLNYLGYSWIDNGENVMQGLAMVEQAVAANPSNGYFVDSLGWAFYRLGEFEKAASFLEHAAILRPNDVDVVDHLGDALWQVGRRFEARYQWERILTLDVSEEKKKNILRKINIGVFEDYKGKKSAI